MKIPLCQIDLAQTISEWKDVSSNKEDDQYLGDICFSLRYVPTSGKLTVGILECKRLKKMDITGASGMHTFGSRIGCPNRTEPRPNRNKNSEKPKPQTAIFSQNHGLQFFARNSAQKWSKLLNFEKVHNFPLNCYPLSSLLNAQGDWFHWNV